eukprot:1473471-Alexandrium_andersonii.AAC.1
MGAHSICKLGFEQCGKLAASVLALACGASWIIEEKETTARFKLVCDHAMATHAVQGLWACSAHSSAVAR